jgi:ribosomal protein RSM22 (predicted rRNA methylase)
MSLPPDNLGVPRTLALPDELRLAVERALAGAPAARWIRAAQELSERYRGPRAPGEKPLAAGEADALGYLALVLPATYAQLRGAMAATALRAPSWAPETLLDLGSGPGTALWAVAAQWPSLRRATAWEREQAFITVGRALAAASSAPAVRGAGWQRADLARPDEASRRGAHGGSGAQAAPRADLVVLGHVLNELALADAARVVATAWEAAAGVLLIVEPGTPQGFAVVRAARDALLSAGARTLAPCAHDAPCPLADDWCHFPQRIWRPEFQRKARGAPSQWEESKFSYAALARFAPDRPIWGRVIREPTSNKAYAEATISAREGILRHRAPKRDRAAYRLVQDLPWGAALDEPPA